MNTTVDFAHGDDLSDLLGGTPVAAPVAPKAAPAGEQWERIRAMADQAPVAQTFKVACTKCNGRGRFVSYAGRDCGPCYTCKGKGSFERKNSATTLAANRAKAADRKVRHANAHWDAFAAARPEVAEWMLANTGFEFAVSLKAAVEKYGELTERQLAAAQKCVARDAERKAARAAAAAPAQAASFPNIQAAFDALLAKGVRRAQMTAADGLNLSMADVTKSNPGAVYVKDAGVYAGKIVAGKFRPGRDAGPTVLGRLLAVEADPRGAVIAHAKLTAERLAAAAANGEKLTLPCGCCGLMLSDPVSVARGIGPICAGKWDF